MARLRQVTDENDLVLWHDLMTVPPLNGRMPGVVARSRDHVTDWIDE